MKRFTKYLRIRGKVQGVFYRKSTQEIARALEITGFVQNEPNGSVYIEASGTEDHLNKLEKWCKEGPPMAVVTKVEVNILPHKNFEDFTILR